MSLFTKGTEKNYRVKVIDVDGNELTEDFTGTEIDEVAQKAEDNFEAVTKTKRRWIRQIFVFDLSENAN